MHKMLERINNKTRINSSRDLFWRMLLYGIIRNGHRQHMVSMRWLRASSVGSAQGQSRKRSSLIWQHIMTRVSHKILSWVVVTLAKTRDATAKILQYTWCYERWLSLHGDYHLPSVNFAHLIILLLEFFYRVLSPLSLAEGRFWLQWSLLWCPNFGPGCLPIAAIRLSWIG